MNKPLVSVIMPVYNGEKYIKQATEDILTIVEAEKMKCSRNKDIKKIFKGEM